MILPRIERLMILLNVLSKDKITGTNFGFTVARFVNGMTFPHSWKMSLFKDCIDDIGDKFDN